MTEQEPQSDQQTYYMYCSLHGFLGSVDGELASLRFAQQHEESTDGWCNVVLSTEMHDPDALDQWSE